MRVDRKPVAQSFQSSVPPVFAIHGARTFEAPGPGRPRETCADALEMRPGNSLCNDPQGIPSQERM
jgi:hypothetical protein